MQTLKKTAWREKPLNTGKQLPTVKSSITRSATERRQTSSGTRT